MSVQVIQAEIQHITQVADIETQHFPDAWSEAFLMRKVQDESILFLVMVFADDPKTVLGYAILQRLGGEAELLRIAVSHTQQNKGFGRILLEHLCKRAQGERIQDIFLEVRVSNCAAISLYENCGFYQIATRKEYYKDNLEDALVMKKEVSCDYFSN